MSSLRLLDGKNKVIIEGMLAKQNDGSFLTRFAWRYCVLAGRHLIYYPEGKEKSELAEPSGSIDLYFADAAEMFSGRDNTICIRSADRRVLFEAPSERDCGLWLSAIQTVIASLRIEEGSRKRELGDETELRGWLDCYVSQMFVKQWKKVWVVMRGGVITYFQDAEKSQRPLGKIALYHAQLKPFLPVLEKNAFEVTTSTNGRNHSMVLRASSAEEMHRWKCAILKQKLAIEETIDSMS